MRCATRRVEKKRVWHAVGVTKESHEGRSSAVSPTGFLPNIMQSTAVCANLLTLCKSSFAFKTFVLTLYMLGVFK